MTVSGTGNIAQVDERIDFSKYQQILKAKLIKKLKLKDKVKLKR